MTDPIADFLTRVRNGIVAQHDVVEIPASKLKREMARILKEQGYIAGYEMREHDAEHRASRPGQRYYVDHDSIPKVQGGMGTTIVSTSSGVMTGHEARAAGVGGEVVAFVW